MKSGTHLSRRATIRQPDLATVYLFTLAHVTCAGTPDLPGQQRLWVADTDAYTEHNGGKAATALFNGVRVCSGWWVCSPGSGGVQCTQACSAARHAIQPRPCGRTVVHRCRHAPKNIQAFPAAAPAAQPRVGCDQAASMQTHHRPRVPATGCMRGSKACTAQSTSMHTHLRRRPAAGLLILTRDPKVRRKN